MWSSKGIVLPDCKVVHCLALSLQDNWQSISLSIGILQWRSRTRYKKRVDVNNTNNGCIVFLGGSLSPLVWYTSMCRDDGASSRLAYHRVSLRHTEESTHEHAAMLSARSRLFTTLCGWQEVSEWEVAKWWRCCQHHPPERSSIFKQQCKHARSPTNIRKHPTYYQSIRIYTEASLIFH